MALKPGDGLFKWEIAVTKKLVGEFRRRSRILWREDFDDLVQDCLLHWIGVRKKLAQDPDNPPVGYMAQVLRNKLTDSMREQGAEKRVGDLSGYGLVNAVTHYSQDVEDYDRATEFEALGGKLIELAPTEWKGLAHAV